MIAVLVRVVLVNRNAQPSGTISFNAATSNNHGNSACHRLGGFRGETISMGNGNRGNGVIMLFQYRSTSNEELGLRNSKFPKVEFMC